MEGLTQPDEELFSCGLCGSQVGELKAPGTVGRGVCEGRNDTMEQGEGLCCSREKRKRKVFKHQAMAEK